SGKKIFGMADALVVNDPITGQGSNNAAKCSKVYFDAILAHGNQAFTEDWMESTFEKYWSYAEKVVSWTNSLLVPPKPHVFELLDASYQNNNVASQIVNKYDEQHHFLTWLFDENAAKELLETDQVSKVA